MHWCGSVAISARGTSSARRWKRRRRSINCALTVLRRRSRRPCAFHRAKRVRATAGCIPPPSCWRTSPICTAAAPTRLPRSSSRRAVVDDGTAAGRHARHGGKSNRGAARTMNQRSWTLFVPLAVYGLLLSWIALSAANVQPEEFSALIYALGNLIVFADAIDFGLRLYAHRRHTAVAVD